MTEGTKNEIKGNLYEFKASVKGKVSKLTNNPNLTPEGQNEKFAGKVQKKLGQIEQVLEK
jgi:uncharacterized protein YjbJ (UPF0337 family)